MKTHFLISRDPVAKWSKIALVLCGKEIRNPEPVSMDLIAPDLSRTTMPAQNSIHDCAKCFRVLQTETEQNFQRLWIYGVAAGQDLRFHEEDDAA